MNKILTVVGARPQFIKAAAVSRVISGMAGCVEILVHTGQHFDTNMSDVFFEELEIPKPQYNLGIGGGHHGQMTGRQLEAIEEVLLQERPDWVLVYGDTNSTLAGALAAVKLHIPVAHVEAGLRSFNRRMPEEINRVLTDHASSLLFTPTRTAQENLAREGISGGKVIPVGDVMFDVALYYRDKALMPKELVEKGWVAQSFVLATVHRAENTDDEARLVQILKGLGECGLPVILPLHPRTRASIQARGLGIPDNIWIIDPVGYLEMVWLEVNSSVIATDSGGVQKEAFFAGTPCVTLRDETEWVELVNLGVNLLVGADAEKISEGIKSSRAFETVESPYGDGRAAEKIVRELVERQA